MTFVNKDHVVVPDVVHRHNRVSCPSFKYACLRRNKQFNEIYPRIVGLSSSFCQCKSYLSSAKTNIILREKYSASSRSINSRLKVRQSENGQKCPLSWCSELFLSVVYRLKGTRFKGKYFLRFEISLDHEFAKSEKLAILDQTEMVNLEDS